MTRDLRPFVDRPVGDTAAAARLARHVAVALNLPTPTLVRVGMNALFRSGDVIVRVGRPSAPGHLSLELADALLGVGVSVPAPASPDVFEHDGLVATCWQVIGPVEQPVDWSIVGRLVRRVHELPLDVVPVGYPVPRPSSFPWWDFDSLLVDVADDIDPDARRGIERAVAQHRGWDSMPDSEIVVCHGDVHPGNVMMSADGPVLLDWDLLCRAVPAWDHAMLLTLHERWDGSPAIYPAFAHGYGRSLADDDVALGLAVLRNVAATLMRVRAGRSDAAARAEAERRLMYWRGDDDAPAWTAQ